MRQAIHYRELARRPYSSNSLTGDSSGAEKKLANISISDGVEVKPHFKVAGAGVNENTCFPSNLRFDRNPPAQPTVSYTKTVGLGTNPQGDNIIVYDITVSVIGGVIGELTDIHIYVNDSTCSNTPDLEEGYGSNADSDFVIDDYLENPTSVHIEVGDSLGNFSDCQAATSAK